MSFWKKNPHFAHGDRPPFLDESDRAALVQDQNAFMIERVVPNFTAQYDGKPTPRWELTIQIEDFVGDGHDGRRTLTLSANPQRDDMFSAMREYLEMRKRQGLGPAKPREFFEALKAGGYQFEAKDAAVERQSAISAITLSTITSCMFTAGA